MKHPRSRLASELRLGVCVGVLLAALFLVALRMDATKLRYRLAETRAEVLSLEERRQQLVVERGRLTDPVDLVQRARALGFEPPQAVIELREGASRAGRR